MKTEFDIQLTPKDMYLFNLYHTYTSVSGYLTIAAAILIAAAAIRKMEELSSTNLVIYLGVAVLLLFYTPVTLYLRSRQQVEGSPVLRCVLHYVIDEEGITTSQGEASSQLAWAQVYRLVATKSNLLIFSNPKNAFVIPRRQVEKEFETIRDLALEHLEKYRLKL